MCIKFLLKEKKKLTIKILIIRHLIEKRITAEFFIKFYGQQRK